MCRAIVREAKAFLFDEPRSNLDAKLRGQMRTEISRLQKNLGITTVYVTHDQVEAMTLGDRVAVLRKGLLQQVATPRELYQHPVNLFVAGFIGSPPMNMVPARLEGTRLKLPFVDVELPEGELTRARECEVLIAGIRPEYFEDAKVVSDEKRGRGVTFEAQLDVIEWLGNEQFAYIPYDAPEDIQRQLSELAQELDSEHLRTQLIVALDAASQLREGETAEIWLDPSHIHLFDPESGDNLTNALPQRDGRGEGDGTSTPRQAQAGVTAAS